METNVKQHVLTFEKGLTNIPSDLACSDDTLSSADGVVFTNSEYKAIQAPAEFGKGLSDGERLMYAHTLNTGTKNYIAAKGNTIYAYNSTFAAVETNPTLTISGVTTIHDITAVGNTLIVNTDKGLYYYLWKGGGYTPLGNHIPEPNVRFMMLGDNEGGTMTLARASVDVDGLLELENGHLNAINQNDWENACVGVYAAAKKNACTKSGFHSPFFVRYAIELHGGTYTLISNPILMLPGIRNGIFSIDWADSKGTLFAHVHYCTLHFLYDCDYSDWKDIVKSITVFATQQVETFLTEDGCGSGFSNTDLSDVTNGVYATKLSEPSKVQSLSTEDYSTLLSKYKGIPFSRKSNKRIIDDLLSNSIFYKLFELPVKYHGSWQSASGLLNSDILKNITVQPRLDNDDFYSHCSLIPQTVTTFNRRLNVIGAKRGFFNGFTEFFRYNGTENIEGTTTYKVTIGTSEGDKVVVSKTDTATKPYLDINITSKPVWFYYPDPRAKSVTIYYEPKTGTKLEISVNLKEHPGLNGAYFFENIPGKETNQALQGTSATSVPTPSPITPESLPNYLLQSEVDNPFTFLASGYVRVGQGTIIGMAGLTTALNQDAYKVATTLAFTTQGIWALSINAQGQYTGVNPPFSREVCNNPASITMTDNAVFFTSERGLMCCTGTSENSVICVSEALADSDFVNFCRTALIAYDYKEQLLLVFQPDASKAYIYSIRSHAWTADTNFFEKQSTASSAGGTSPELRGTGPELRGTASEKKFLTAVVDYPDTLLQTDDGQTYSLLQRLNRHEDKTRYNVTFTTRPLKFDASLIQKSIRQIKHLVTSDVDIKNTETEFGLASQTPELRLTIQASDDLRTWYDITSRRGRGYKFFRFQFDFRNITATTAYSGIVVTLQSRYPEKLI